MKIYFSSSLRAKKQYGQNFKLIYDFIKEFGYSHTSDFIISHDPDDFYKKGDFAKFYQNLLNQIKKADICVFEVTLHSLGIGYCVNLALQMGKPVILLYYQNSNPVFFKGLKSDKLQIYKYTRDNIKEVLVDALTIAKEAVDIRFTFFITPQINRFFNWIAKNKKIPRAVYLRNLLDIAIKKENFK